jgi:hypothetical protein
MYLIRLNLFHRSADPDEKLRSGGYREQCGCGSRRRFGGSTLRAMMRFACDVIFGVCFSFVRLHVCVLCLLLSLLLRFAPLTDCLTG